MSHRVVWIFDAILNVGAVLSGALVLAVMVVTCVKVLFRYVLREGLIGVDQISGAMLLYITFLGAAWVLRRDEHVAIDLLVGRLRLRARRRLDGVNALVGALLCFVLTLYGSLEVVDSWRRGILIPAELEIPRVVNLVVIPVGSLFLGLQFVRRALR